MVYAPKPTEVVHIFPYTWWGIAWIKLTAKHRAVLYALTVVNALLVAVGLSVIVITVWTLLQGPWREDLSKTSIAGIGILFLLIMIRIIGRDTIRLTNFLILTRYRHAH